MFNFRLRTLLGLLVLASVVLAWAVDRGTLQARIDDLATKLFTSEESVEYRFLPGRPTEEWESYSNPNYAWVVMRNDRRIDIQLLDVVRAFRKSSYVADYPNQREDLSKYARSILQELGVQTSEDLKTRLSKQNLERLIIAEEWSDFIEFVKL